MTNPLERGAKIIYPEPWNPEDYETVRELNPALQGEVPDPRRFPWPPGGEDGPCGCQFKTFNDSRDGNIKLEVIWQPLWDTQVMTDFIGQLWFFQNPGDRNTTQTNVVTAGQLSWPKKFYLWELVFQFSFADINFFIKEKEEACKQLWNNLRDDHVAATITIGEKIHFNMPLNMMFNPREGHYRAALPMPLLIPSVQNFSVRLNFKGRHSWAGMKNKIRCMLHGYLAREIP